MTPNLNASPLAALIANAASSPQGAETPLQAAGSLSPGSSNSPESRGKFFNILQIHKEISSNITEQVSRLELRGPLLPAEGLESVQTLPSAVSAPASQGQVQPLPGMLLPAQAQSIISKQKQLDSASLESEAETGEGTLVSALTVPVQGSVSLPGELDSGTRSPQSGNSLPPGINSDQFKGQRTQESVQTIAGEPRQTLTPAKALSMPAQEPLTQPLSQSPAATAPLPAPLAELAGQMMRLQRPSPGVTNAGTPQSIINGISDSVSLISEQEGATADLIRGTATPQPLDRANPVQQVTAPIPLPRMAGAPGWDQGLGQRILWMVDNGLNQAELRLDPPNLGTVNVRISVQDDQAQLLFQAAHPAAREALESALPRLREMFAQQGLELGNADVSEHNERSTGEGGAGQDHLPDDGAKESNRAGTLAGGELSAADSGVMMAGAVARDSSLIDEFV